MPAGPGPIGFLAFTGVKFAGYTAAAELLNRAYGSSRSSWKVGLARTGIGLAFGITFGAISIFVSGLVNIDKWPDWAGASLFFGSLVPIRLVEWSLLIHIFFDRGLVQRVKALKLSGLGILWSFALDAVGLAFAWVVPGGFWVC